MTKEKNSNKRQGAKQKGKVKMKETGVEWLGKVPKEWEVRRFCSLLSEPLKYGANEVAQFENSFEPRYIRITDIKEDGSLNEKTFKSIPEKLAEPYLLSSGDILLARSGATVGKSFIYRTSWGRAAYAGYLIRARFKKNISTNFIFYFLNSTFYWNWLNSIYIQATIQNVSATKYRNLLTPLPLLSEQKAIADFLDKKTARIDQLIEKKGRMIELLQEKRSALISHAVTKGLDPKALLKGSGVEWLGKVPKRWDVRRLKYVAILQKGRVVSNQEQDNFSNGLPLLSMDYFRGREGERKILPSLNDILAQDGDILILWDGANAGEFLKAKEGVLSSTLCKVGIIKKNYKSFFFYTLVSAQSYIQSECIGMGIPHVNGKSFKMFKLPLPPLLEQKAIADFLDKKTARIDQLIEKTKEAIDLLKESRSSHISHAVTGKIAVEAGKKKAS